MTNSREPERRGQTDVPTDGRSVDKDSGGWWLRSPDDFAQHRRKAVVDPKIIPSVFLLLLRRLMLSKPVGQNGQLARELAPRRRAETQGQLQANV